MNEGYHAGEAMARRFIDEAGAACLQRIEFTLQVFDFQADVVERLSAGIEEPGDAGVGADGLDELQVCPADSNQGSKDALIGDFLDSGIRDAEGFLVEAEGLGGILDHYGDVVNVAGLADRCGILCH